MPDRKVDPKSTNKIARPDKHGKLVQLLESGMLRDPAENYVGIDLGDNATKEKCHELLRQLSAVIYSLPTTQPSPDASVK